MSPTWSGSFGEVAPGVTKGTPACWKIGPSASTEVGIGEAERDRHLVLVRSWLAVEAITVGSVLVS